MASMSAKNALAVAAFRLQGHGLRHWEVVSLSRARRLSGSAHACGLAELGNRRSRTMTTFAAPVVAEAGILSMLGIAGAGLVVTGSSAWWFLHEEPLERKARLGPGTLKYLCEGSHTIVCSYVGKYLVFRTGLEGCIVQLVKDKKLEDNDGSTWKEWRHRAAALSALGYRDRAVKREYLDRLQLLDVPLDDINKLDTELFFVRPADCREQRLSRADARDGLGLAVAVSDLFKAPPNCQASPLLAFEFSPGCGLREVADLPSRDALLLGGKATVDPQDLYSGDKSKVVNVLKGHLKGVLMGCPRVYSDGEPVFPSGLPGSSRTVSRTTAGDVQVKFPGCGLADAGQLVDAVAAVLSNQQGCTVLPELQDLQQLAGGETEKTASALLALLLEHGGEERVAALKEEAVHVDAIYNAGRLRSHGTARREYFEKEGRRLMSTKRWGESQLAAAQRWLGMFLLGRAAFDARLLVSFVSAPEADVKKNVELKRAHFIPLKDMSPTLPSAEGIWVRVTILGLEEAVDPAIVSAKATELEDAIRLHRGSRGATA